MTLPIKKSKKESKGKLPIQIYLGVFRWIETEFINLQTQTIEEHELWEFVTNDNLNNQFKNGRKTFGEIEKYKTRNVRGEIVECERRELKGRVFGYKAVADALSEVRGLPISEEKVKEMIQSAINSQISHAKFVLESDLYPTSPQLYKEMGLKNKWLILADIPNSDIMHKKVNEQLKKAGSPLRIEKAIKTRIVEA
jgi:hypothetical protein